MEAVVPTLRHKNVIRQVDLPLIGRQGEPFGETGSGCLEPGEEFDVSDAHAGRAPSTSKDADGNDVFDPGEGLLAQVDNYELVVAPKTKKGDS
jgi:hypothetical protein